MTERPTPEEIEAKWLNRSTLTAEQLHDVALDCLDFVASVLEVDGKILVQLPNGEPRPVDFTIQGLTT